MIKDYFCRGKGHCESWIQMSSHGREQPWDALGKGYSRQCQTAHILAGKQGHISYEIFFGKTDSLF